MSGFTDPDWVLIEKFYGGDASAFRPLFEKHKVRVLNLSYRFVRRWEVAEDIAQDVFLKVYERKVSVDRRVRFSTWLHRVTVNASLDYLRSKGSRLFSLEEKPPGDEGEETRLEKTADPASLSPREAVAAGELRALVRREVDALPEKLRTCVLLYQFEAMPYQEIARILGTTPKAVERRLYHAKKLLRKALSSRLDV